MSYRRIYENAASKRQHVASFLGFALAASWIGLDGHTHSDPTIDSNSRGTTRLDDTKGNEDVGNLQSHNSLGPSQLLSKLAPLPPLRVLRPNPNLEICFDTRTRNSVYVQHRIEVLPRDVERKLKRSRMRFKEDKLVEERYRSRNSYYHLTGYDRGHMAPAGDFYGGQLEDTYSLSNISPQDSEMNRQIWAWLEEWTRRVARTAYETNHQAVTVVTTGPLWLPSHQTDEKKFLYNLEGIGRPPTVVLVPTHFFKVVVVLDKDCTKILTFACFVVPNRASANDRPLQEYMVPWTDLETVSGLTFYPGLADDSFKAKADWLTTQQQKRAQPVGKPVLLLTDGKGGSGAAGGGTFSKWSYRELKHLCESQACISPKQREQQRQ